MVLIEDQIAEDFDSDTSLDPIVGIDMPFPYFCWSKEAVQDKRE